MINLKPNRIGYRVTREMNMMDLILILIKIYIFLRIIKF